MAGIATVGDVYELVDEQRLDGQEMLDVYYYRLGDVFVTTDPTIAQALAEQWAAQILPGVLGVQSSDVGHSQIRVRNLYNEGDAFNLVVSESGAISAVADSDFDALSFVLQGESAVTRKGAKRIGGLTDASNTRGVVTDSTTLTAAATLADLLATPVAVGLIIPSNVFYPVIVKRIRAGVSGSYTYRLPANAGEGVTNAIINALFNVLVTSQTSRKQGVGS